MVEFKLGCGDFPTDELDVVEDSWVVISLG